MKAALRPIFLVLLTLACLLRAVHSDGEEHRLFTPHIPLGPRPVRPRPRIHVYDMPGHLAKPCWWWGCRQLTQYVKETNVRRVGALFLNLHL